MEDNTAAGKQPPLELWGGVECTVNRVEDRWFDQLTWSGHCARLNDLDLIARLGIRTLRFPILWERLAPDSLDDIDWTTTDRQMARLRELGIRPIVGLLHHGSGPAYTSLLDEGFPEKLARFAGLVARRYPWVTDFTPVNEPLTTARFSGLYGHWYPHGRSDKQFIRILLNELKGTVLAMRAVRTVNPEARLIQTEDCGRTFGTRATRSQVAFENGRRLLTWDLLCGCIIPGHPMRSYLRNSGMTDEEERFFRHADCAPDILGLNYYVTSDRYLDEHLDRYPSSTHGGNGYVKYADLEAVRARPDGIVGHTAHIVDAWKRYGIPVAITEVHIGCTRDEQMRWLIEAWDGARRARAKGADVRAITAWALLGSFNWRSLVTRDEQHYEPGAFDVRGAEPRPTALASAIEQLARGEMPAHPAIAGASWWHRPDRLSYAPIPRTASPSAGASPLLIIGATGTLGRALQRVCEERGLPAQIVGRKDVDIADATQTDAILRRLQPWAVINAAGYVRVDDAERDREACRRANLLGPVNLAAACRRRGVPLVTFSSDLVFDGRAGRAYVESDEPSPLNCYGAAKAEAERRVLELLPESLVIRTSAFFGPWDDYNFLACLFRALDEGQPFDAPHDSVVSPTYVPDLAHATLDLLIDRERGIWHVANEGAVSWFEFARAAAERAGLSVDLIRPVETSKAWGPASRPRHSALGSDRGRLLSPLDAALDAFIAQTREARTAVATGTDCLSSASA